MAPAIPGGKPKLALYKMVTVTTVKKSSAGMGSSISPYSSFVKGMNGIGATLNSVVVVNKQIRDALVENLKMRAKELDDDKKRFDREKADKGKGTGTKKVGSSLLGGFAKLGVPDFFAGLAQMAQFVMRAVIGQALLRWIANPANQTKLVRIWEGISKIFQWLAKFITDNLFKTIDGLMVMFDDNAGFWEKLQGFGSFITGFGALLLGYTFLKKPKLIINGFRFVLETLFKNLLRSKKNLASRAWTCATAAAAASGGRGGLVKAAIGAAAIGTTLAVAGSMGSSPPEDVPSPVPGASPAPALKVPDTAPRHAKGGIITRPHEAVIGEKGPEIRLPLGKLSGSNEQRRKDAGVKPLSSLGGFGGGKPDTDKSKKLSDLFMAPFKGIGAGILSNIVSTVSGLGPAGAAITPILGNIIAPIANSFGVPSSLVKKISGKTDKKVETKGATKGTKKNFLASIFGTGKKSKETGKQFTRKGDTTVLGLLTDLFGTAQVINNKLGGEKLPPPPPPSSGGSSGSGAGGPMSSIGNAAKGAVNAAGNLAKGAVNTAKSVGSSLLNATKDIGSKTLDFFKSGAPNLLNMGSTTEPKKEANGGWIHGPMSGYPVSLDGMSTSFIGHGTEWVGTKRSSGGGTSSAFVIPFNTPATQNNPRLTASRYAQAKAGGFVLPNRSSGGVIKAANWLKRYEGYKDTAYWDVNHYRVGYGSDTQTKADGSVVSVSKGYKTNKDDAERDLQRRTNGFLQGAKRAVGANFESLDDNTQAALTSLAYNYGSVPSSVVKAAQGKDKEAIAKAIEGLQNHDNGVNRKRRLDEANLVRGKIGISGSSSTGPSNTTDSSSSTSSTPTDAFAQIESAISGLNEKVFGITPSESVGTATDKVKGEKDKADKANKDAQVAGAAALVNSAGKTAPGKPAVAPPPPPVILPSIHKRALTVEQALNPRASMIQYA